MSESPQPPPKSYGNMGPEHWSRARAGTNEEALEYYRQRSQAPGVAAGGAERNFYCMHCAGVIPHQAGLERCPHCGEALDEAAKRYFNWVEINEPPRSELWALLRPLLWIGLGLTALGALAWCFWKRGGA